MKNPLRGQAESFAPLNNLRKPEQDAAIEIEELQRIAPGPGVGVRARRFAGGKPSV
ncbi:MULTISPECIES: hypothetical protein [unclassified Phaeobacter]|uniref:hypothetical protein n=1 Tax=unclassified Phaeobacter TaxID=2621772 RepID=UPI003A863DC0